MHQEMAEAIGGDTDQVNAQPPQEEELRVRVHGSDEEKWKNVRHLLLERMDPDFGLLDKLLNMCALTVIEIGLIKGKTSIFERNDKLLELIFKKMEQQALLTALIDTEQKHLVNLFRGNGRYRPEYGAVWPLRERETQILDVNRFNLVDMIYPPDLITRMISKGVINNRQHMYINSLPTDTEKAGALLDILRRGSEMYYWTTVRCLEKTKQSHIAEILKDGGVLEQVHVSNEGKAELANAEEDNLLEVMVDLLQDKMLPQDQRIRERLEVRIMRARKDQSVVFYIYCKTMDEPLRELLTKGEFKKCIASGFDLLISKTKTTVLEEEFTTFKTYFEDAGGWPTELEITQQVRDPTKVPSLAGRITNELPDIMGLDDETPRVKMSCDHAIAPSSLALYCYNEIKDGESKIKCPAPNCYAVWPLKTIIYAACLSPSEINEFELKMISKRLSERWEDIGKCPGCGNYCRRLNENKTRIRCKICTSANGRNFYFCWSCQRQWKNDRKAVWCGNLECVDHTEPFECLANCGTKTLNGIECPSKRACPRCLTLIEHKDKCKHMKCPNKHCRYEFCFICLEHYPCETGAHKSCPLAPRQSPTSFRPRRRLPDNCFIL